MVATLDEYIEFTNARGVTVRFKDAPYKLVRIEGLGDASADIQMQKTPYQDGMSFIGTELEARYMPIELIVAGANYAEVQRNRTHLASILNPKLGVGTLRYRTGSVVRELDAVAENVPTFSDGDARGKRWQRAWVTLIAPNPYWRSAEITGEPAFEPVFEFPFDDVFEMGVQRDVRIIDNDGDAPAPINVEFYGPANSPMIKNLTTGEFIRVNRRLEEGETFKIDTSDDEQSLIYVDVDGNETDVFHWIDLNSTFFKLSLGENEISCECAISNNQKDFVIYYSKHYTAV